LWKEQPKHRQLHGKTLFTQPNLASHFYFPHYFGDLQYSFALDRVSLKKYPELSIPVPNPMETSKLPARETFQVNHEEFILQFFFNGRDIFGYILKRNKRRAIHFRWCFFRNCEESPHDFKKVIAQAFNPPYSSGFFSIKFPSYLSYSFQGMVFSSPK
tara:strand:+ start:191 stop:664 length:474 start_codon:yes stop_codon:yes gene_type:complete